MRCAALSVLQEPPRIGLRECNEPAFVEALLNPAEANEALREAAQAYSRTKAGRDPRQKYLHKSSRYPDAGMIHFNDRRNSLPGSKPAPTLKKATGLR
jgi:hypothetical protein